MKLYPLGIFGPYPAAGAAASGYLLEENGTRLVMDMGAGTLARLLEICDIEEIDGIFISHLHYDHTSDLLPLRYLLEEKNKTMRLITQKSDTEWYKILTSHPLLEVVEASVETELRLSGLTLRFFEMQHTAACLAVRVEGEKTLVYSGDTVYCEELLRAVQGADCLLADCAKPIGFTGPHMSADKAILLYEKTGVPIIATHLSPDFSPEEIFAPYDKIKTAKMNCCYDI